VVEKGGLPVAVIMSMREYERLVRNWSLKEFEQLARAFGEEAERQGLTEEKLMAELAETRKQVYQEV